MPKYQITEKAGRYVAGMRNTGVGTDIVLTEKQAEAALREGSIVAALTKEEAAEVDKKLREEAEKEADAEKAKAAKEAEAKAKADAKAAGEPKK